MNVSMYVYMYVCVCMCVCSGAHDMDQSIMFEDRQSLQQQQQAAGVQEFPFCPKRPDQELSAEQMLLLSEYSDDSDNDNDNDNDNDGGDGGHGKGGAEGGCEDGMAVGFEELDLKVSSQDLFFGDGASTIATNENTSFAPGLSLSLFPQAIDEAIQATTHPVPISPRSKYLVGCLKDNVNPRASLITRRKVSHQLKMQHLGKEVLVIAMATATAQTSCTTVVPYCAGDYIAHSSKTLSFRTSTYHTHTPFPRLCICRHGRQDGNRSRGERERPPLH